MSALLLIYTSVEDIEGANAHQKPNISQIIQEIVPTILPSIVGEVAKQMESQQKKLFSQMLASNTKKTKQSINQTIRTQQEQQKTMVETVIHETALKVDNDALERTKRACNVIVFKVNECGSSDKKRETAHDMGFAIEELGIPEEEIVAIFRSGRKFVDDSGRGINKNQRPLVIKLTSPSSADYWHCNGRGYKTRSGFYINKDLCRADREAEKRARAIRDGRRNVDSRHNQTPVDARKRDVTNRTVLRRNQTPVTSPRAAPIITEDISDDDFFTDDELLENRNF